MLDLFLILAIAATTPGSLVVFAKYTSVSVQVVSTPTACLNTSNINSIINCYAGCPDAAAVLLFAFETKLWSTYTQSDCLF